jgi:hypothetical protein
MRKTDATVAVLPSDSTETMTGTAFAALATIVSVTDSGMPQVSVAAGELAVTARLAVRTTLERIERAIANREPAVVVFEDGDRARPLIVGFLEPLEPARRSPASSSHPPQTGTVSTAQDSDPAPAPDAEENDPMPIIEADVDGRRVRLTARDEIVLECGSASVTLRRNGRVVIRGTYVETHSEGTNRIKGGQVHIN